MEQDERSKKLQAGKEKLAAFQRKRVKRKKKKEDEDAASEYTWSETSSLADLSDVASTGDFSDTGSVVDENDRTVIMSEEESDSGTSGPRVSRSVALVRAQSDVRKMSSRIMELEEELQGKQDAMSRLIDENKELQTSLTQKSQIHSTSETPMSITGSLDDQGGSTDDREPFEPNMETYKQKLDEFETALKKRDEVIAQLTENLRATTESRDNLQQEYTAQATELARQVQTLQLQLKQAGEWLKNHMGEHGISAQALLEAKNELLALQQVNSHKEQELAAARAAITERDQALQKVVDQYKIAAEQVGVLHQEYNRIREQNEQYTQYIQQLTQAKEESESEKLALVQQLQEAKNDITSMQLQSKEFSKVKEELMVSQLRINTLQKSLDERESEMGKMKDVIEQKDQSLQMMVQTSMKTAQGNDSGDMLRETVTQLQSEISNLKDMVTHKDQKLQQLNEKFTKTSDELQNLYMEVSVLKEKEQEIALLRETIGERENMVVALQNTIQTNEEKLHMLQQSFVEQQNEEKGDGIKDETLSKIQAEVLLKESLLQEASEKLRVLNEEKEKLERERKNENQVLMSKLQQLSTEYSKVVEENKQLKETEIEVNEIAAKIPQLGQEMQRLGEENKTLRQKESEMLELVTEMKKREDLLNSISKEKQQLVLREEELQKHNTALQQRLESLESLSQGRTELEARFLEIQQKASILEAGTVELQQKNNALNKTVEELNELVNERSELIRKLEEHDKEKMEKITDLQKRHEDIVSELSRTDEANKLLQNASRQLEQQLQAKSEEQQKVMAEDSAKASELSTVQTEVESLRTATKEKDASLIQLSEAVERLSNEVTRLSEENANLLEQKTHIENLQKQLNDSKTEASELRSTLEHKESMLEETRNSVNSLEIQVSELTDENKTMKEKQNELKQLKCVVVEKEKEVAELSKAISDKDRNIEEITASLNDIKELNENLKTQISGKEEALEKLEQELMTNQTSLVETSDREKAMESEKDGAIEELKKSIKLKQDELDAIQRQLSEQDASREQLESTIESLKKHLELATNEMGDQEQKHKDLLSELSAKDSTNGKLQDSLKEKQSCIVELEEKLGLLTEQFDSVSKHRADLQDTVAEREQKLADSKKEISELQSKSETYQQEIKSLKKECEDLKHKNDDLRDKGDLQMKSEGEVIVLKEALQDRDNKLVELTDSMAKLTEDVTQITQVNELLQVREEELLKAQKHVQQHIDAVNEEVKNLKEENQELAQKEQLLLEKQEQLAKLNALVEQTNTKLTDLQEEHDHVQEANKVLLMENGQLTKAKEDMVTLTLQLEDLVREKAGLNEKLCELQKDHKDLKASQEESSAVKEQMMALTRQYEDLGMENSRLKKEIETHQEQGQRDTDALGRSSSFDYKNELHTVQECLASLQVENGELRTSTKNARASDENIEKNVEGVQEAANETFIVEKETCQQLAATPDISPVADKVQELEQNLAEKEEETRTLQNSIQTQHAALQQMHKQLTEVTQYVTYLSQENQALKERVDPNSPSNAGSTEEQPKAETPEVNDHRDTLSVDKLQSQIAQQAEALEDMSNRYSKLVEENHGLKQQLHQKSQKPSPESTTEMAAANKDEAEIAKLHTYIQQQSAHMEQMSQRMNEMAQYITQVQEQNRILQERDELQAKALQNQASEAEEATKQQKLIKEQTQKELKESVEKNEDALKVLDEENRMLKRKEKESCEVVQQLMKDIEDIRRSRSQTPSSSDVVAPEGSVSADDHKWALEALRAELEEQHGEQIVEMKHQIISNMKEQIHSLTTEKNDALEKLDAFKNHSPEDIEAGSMLNQQLQAKLRGYEEERAEYVDKLKEQHGKFTSELRTIIKERDAAQTSLTEAEAKIQQVSSEAQAQQESQTKQIDLLNERLAEVMSERNGALDQIESMLVDKSDSKPEDEESQLEAAAREHQVAEMAKQLQDLARERDEALSRIQAQEQSLQQQHTQAHLSVQNQVVDALKNEIDVLNAQLNDVTSAKEAALTHVQNLQKAMNSQGEASNANSQPQTSPVRHKVSPERKPLSPMQQQLLHLRQQLMHDSPPKIEEATTETEGAAPEPSTTKCDDSQPATKVDQSEGKSDVQIKQMQELYDQHCQHQAHQIEQLTADLARVNREREELNTQLEQYQKHYESHVQKLVEQEKEAAACRVKAIHDEMNEVKKERDGVSEKFDMLQAQTRTQIRELSEQVNAWKAKYHDMSEGLSGDSSVSLSRVHAETARLQSEIDDLHSKVEKSTKEKEEAKAQVKELQIAYYDLEGKNPDVAGYRQKLEDIESTLKVTWIENEELKTEVASLKSKLPKDNDNTPEVEMPESSAAVEGIEDLKSRLSSAETELERLQPLVGVEVIVLMRQMEELRSTYAHQLRVHAQELTAVKCELARYQNLDSDSSESPIHKTAPAGGFINGQAATANSVDVNIELGRAQAEHQLEVESLKKSKVDLAKELHDEKERHRDAMARIEQLLKKMVGMQQKHKQEVENQRKNHEDTVHTLSVQIEEMKVRQMVHSGSVGVENVTEMKIHFDSIISEKQRLLTERDKLLQEKGEWDCERERLKGRIAQLVGEKDLLAKEHDTVYETVQKYEKEQADVKTQQRLLHAEKQQLMLEREQVDFAKGQNGKGGGKRSGKSKASKSEVAVLQKYKDQVSLLQQERALLVDDHKLELKALTDENSRLKHRLVQSESEKMQEIEELRERLSFDINELQMKLECIEQDQQMSGSPPRAKQKLEQLRAENEDLVKEYSSRAVTQLAEWQLEREEMKQEFEIQLESVAKEKEKELATEISQLKAKMNEAIREATKAKKSHDSLKSEHNDLLEALRAQEAELVKLQNACSNMKEERDTLQSEYSRILTSLPQDDTDAVAHLTSQVQHMTAERQAIKDEHTQVMTNLQQKFNEEKAKLNTELNEVQAKHSQDLIECSARHEAEIEAYKQKHAEILDEVHTLRRENYEMRTVVSDPQHIREVAPNNEMPLQSTPILEKDSLSPTSEEEKDFQMMKEQYAKKLQNLEDKHQKDLKETESCLQERYELSQRQLKVEYQCDLKEQIERLKEDATHETERQLKVARIENERKFVSELQNARQELSSRYEAQLNDLRRHHEQQDPYQSSGENSQELQDIITRLQLEKQELAETRDSLLQQIDTAHGHQEELQEEIVSVSVQKDKLITENFQLQHRVAQLTQDETAPVVLTEPNWRPLPEATVQFTHSHPQTSDVEHKELLEKYALLLSENQKLQQQLSAQTRLGKSPSLADSLEGSLEQPDIMMRLQDQVRSLEEENKDLRNHLDDQNLAAHEELGELQGKYIQLVAENESLLAKLQRYNPDDSLDNVVITGADRRETERLQSCYATLAQENEVLRAKLGSYGLPTESVPEDENLDLASRYELIRKENEGLRSKLQAYTHQGASERDGRWKEKYDAILHDYAILRSQLEELGLPINDSIQKGLEELQVKFDQVVKEKETLQVKLTTVRENAEQDFRELQARHSELNANFEGLSKEYEDLKAMLHKDKDKSKREYLKAKSTLANATKEMEALKNKFEKTNKEAEALKARLEQAEARLKQEASGATGGAGKGKKRKQDRPTPHNKGRKQRRESEVPDDSVEMADQYIKEELDSLKTQYSSVVMENDALKSEVGGLKCELGSLKGRLMDSLRHRLRDPPVAHSTPLDSDFVHSQGRQSAVDGTPTGRPNTEPERSSHSRMVQSSSASDLDLSSPEDVEALRLRYEAALQELGELRNELDKMNSKALDELMGLQSEANALEEENASMKQVLKKEGPSLTEVERDDTMNSKHQQQLLTIQKQLEELTRENEELKCVIGSAAASSHTGQAICSRDSGKSKLTHRTVHSESEIQPVKAELNMASVPASDTQLSKEKAKRMVSLGSVAVDVDQFPVEVDQVVLGQESQAMSSVIPSSSLEGGQLEAEWKRILRMRSRAESAGDSVVEEGFHPEVDRDANINKKSGAFIPDSPQMETQIVWPITKGDSTDIPLMSIEDEFKLQLESMVASFGEQNVREQLGRDYIEIHQKCEAIKEENERLRQELGRKGEELPKIQVERDGIGGSEVFSDGNDVEQVAELKQELVRLRDENQLLLQENSTLEAQYESKSAKSAWQETVIKGDLEGEMEHLKADKAKLEAEINKIKSLYTTLKEHSNKLSVENEELTGDKLQLERELQVLRSVLEALRQEKVKVESELEERVSKQAIKEELAAEGGAPKVPQSLSAESGCSQKKARKKSPARHEDTEKDLHQQHQVGKGSKKGKKTGSLEPETSKKSRASPTPTKDKYGSPHKAMKEPPAKVKKVAQNQVYGSKETLVLEDKSGMSQLRQKVKELTAKNKTLTSEAEALKKQLQAADRTKDISKLQNDNKALLQELEEMRSSLKSQGKLSDQIQDLRSRVEALNKEKETLKRENQTLSDRINDEVSPPMMEFEELKVQNESLHAANRSLTEKLDRDLMQAEHELAEMRDKYNFAEMQKREIEDEYKNVRDRLEKELYNLTARYDEVVEERDLLETQLINNREHAEKDYQQLQAGYEEMRNEFEEMQRAYDSDKEKARKELTEIRFKLESSKQDNEELKREIQGMAEDGERGKTGMQQQCALLQEEKHSLNRDIKEYNNRLTVLEKEKEELEKQLRELRTRHENLSKYHEEEKGALEEESDMYKKKFESLKADYDMLAETIEELKMEKNNLVHELSDSHAWCETLEMNLKETESTMHKETVTLKEELQFISEKLENETSVRNNLVTAEEELRQKLIETSQELDKVKREASLSKDKLAAKLDSLQLTNDELAKQKEMLQHKLIEKESEIEKFKTDLAEARESLTQSLKDYEEISQAKNAMENEYCQMRKKFGVTESELQDFRKSYLTENMESGKLMSRFRVQFEQVTQERDRLKTDLDQMKQQLEEIKAKHTVQLEDNRALRCAIGAEVDIRFQTVSQIESMLGDDVPPLSPISPLCQSPAVSEASSDFLEESGPSSGKLITKLQKQNTSLAMLIQELERIKVARDKQMSRISSKYQSLQASFNDSQISYTQDRSQLEDEIEDLRSQRRQLLETNDEMESKLQEMAKRCRVLEEELLRMQRDSADGTSSSISTTEKGQTKYVVEMEDDILTVSTMSIALEEEEANKGAAETMQCSQQLESPIVMASSEPLHAHNLQRRNTDPELKRLKEQTWEKEYHVLQDKYMELLKENEKIWQRVRRSPSHGGSSNPLDLEGELTIEVTDSSVIELIEENSRLHALTTKLENELMSQRIDRLEVDTAYTELTWLREQKVRLEEKLRLQLQMFTQEKQVLEQRLNELQTSLDKVITMKRKTSEEIHTLKSKYSDLLAVSSDEVKGLAEQVRSDEDRQKLVLKVSEMEKITELESQLQHERNEKEFLQVQVAHLKKECELYERHVRDLEKEIDEEYSHLHEASREHKTMVQLLAETKLELELNREKHQEVAKIGQTVDRIEAQLSGRSTPQSSLLSSPPLLVTASNGSSPSQHAIMDSRPSTSCDSRDDTPHGGETSRIVEEMIQLRHEIMEAKSMYTRESSILKRAQQQSASSDENAALKDELMVIEEQNLLLKRENEDLQKRLTEQEELVFHLQARLSSGTPSTDDSKDTLEAVFNQQIAIFKSERDTLHEKLSVLEQREQKSRDLRREKTVMEETFNQERNSLKQKLQEKELNEFELIRKINALEKHIREQQRLEELIYHKSSLDDEIRRQKESFDHELLDVEKILQDQRNTIKTERVKLLGELKQRYWQKMLRVDDAEMTDPAATQLTHKPKGTAYGFERLSRMKTEVEQKYREAIERLRHELHADRRYPPGASTTHSD